MSRPSSRIGLSLAQQLFFPAAYTSLTLRPWFIPSTEDTQLSLNLKMTSAQVVTSHILTIIYLGKHFYWIINFYFTFLTKTEQQIISIFQTVVDQIASENGSIYRRKGRNKRYFTKRFGTTESKSQIDVLPQLCGHGYSARRSCFEQVKELPELLFAERGRNRRSVGACNTLQPRWADRQGVFPEWRLWGKY